MVYLVGGTPRSGKTTIAVRFMLTAGVPYQSIDYIKMGLARGAPILGIDPNRGDLITAKQLRPILDGMIRTYVENEDDYLLEGAYLLPKYVASLHKELGEEVAAVFVGYADIDTMEKVQTMRRFCGRHRDWVSDDDNEMIAHVESLKAFSETIRDDCRRHGLMYFESSDHMATIEAVVRYLANMRQTRDKGIH